MDFERLEHEVIDAIRKTVGQVATKGGPHIENVMLVGMILVVAWQGLRIVYGQSALLLTYAVLILKLSVILLLLGNWPFYYQKVVDPVTATQEAAADLVLSSVLGSGGVCPGADASSAAEDMRPISQFYKCGMQAAEAMYDSDGGSALDFGIDEFFFAAVIWVCTIVVCLVAFVILLMSKAGLWLCFAMGPFALALIMFEYTKGLFEGWLKLVFGFIFTYLFGAIMLAALLNATEPVVTEALREAQTNSDNRMETVGAYAFVCIFMVLILMQAPNLGVAMGGGTALTTMGYGRIASGYGLLAAGAVASKAGRGAKNVIGGLMQFQKTPGGGVKVSPGRAVQGYVARRKQWQLENRGKAPSGASS